MTLSDSDKSAIKSEIVECLVSEEEVTRIVVFGSFVHSASPHDVDIAVFQNSGDKYLPLALKYRRDVRPVSRQIPVDIFPVRDDVDDDPFLLEINHGEVIYDRRAAEVA